MDIGKQNQRLLAKLSVFLNETPEAIDAEMMNRFCTEMHMNAEEGYACLLAACMNMDPEGEDRELVRNVFPEMVHCLNPDLIRKNPYYLRIRLPEFHQNGWQTVHAYYQPCQAFVADDFHYGRDGSVIPQIGFFEEKVSFPSVMQNGLEWMSITPNEIQTMAPAIARAEDNVLTYGLGLGYFAYMASLKKEVRSVTVIEKDPDIIELFQKQILPQFEQKEKIRILQKDALEYARTSRETYDYTFVDLWRDASDGLQWYQKLKPYRKKNTDFWIMETMKYYLKEEPEIS